MKADRGFKLNHMENTQTKRADVLEKFSGSAPFAPLKPPRSEKSTETAEYQALVENTRPGRMARFRIVDAKGNSYGSGYAYLMGWLYTPPDILVINTTTHIFTLEGQGLEEIERALMDEKVRELREYNPLTHKLTGIERTVLERLEVQNRFEANI